jgi:hypothetical protein
MSNVQHQVFGHTTVVNAAVPSNGGASLQTAAAPPAQAAAAAPSLLKRAGVAVAPDDMRGLLPDIAGIAVLVTALGAYGGFW